MIQGAASSILMLFRFLKCTKSGNSNYVSSFMLKYEFMLYVNLCFKLMQQENHLESTSNKYYIHDQSFQLITTHHASIYLLPPPPSLTHGTTPKHTRY